MTDVIAGRFALSDPIARGGSGVVWRAYDRKAQKFCAAKVLRRRDAGDLLRFVREQSFRISDPHVLTPYSWAAEDAHVVIASDLVDGGSLANLLSDIGPLSEPTAAVVLDQLLGALHAVHDAGLVHRDVKPANLLLRATGTMPLQVLLSDFGLAMGEEDARLTQVGMIVGTPGYVAPELLTGGAAVHAKQDLYAAGRVAAALLIGSEPSGSTEPDLGGVRDPALRELITMLTAVNPARRPDSAADAQAWLRARVRADARPRARDGRPIEVRHQLPPIPDVEDVIGVSDGSSVPMSAAATGQVTTPANDTRLVGPRLPQHPAQETPRATRPAEQQPSSDRPRWLLVGAGAVVVTAVVVISALMSGSDDNGPTTTERTGRVVSVGSSCDWPDQNTTAVTSSGRVVTCELQSDGYVWR